MIQGTQSCAHFLKNCCRTLSSKDLRLWEAGGVLDDLAYFEHRLDQNVLLLALPIPIENIDWRQEIKLLHPNDTCYKKGNCSKPAIGIAQSLTINPNSHCTLPFQHPKNSIAPSPPQGSTVQAWFKIIRSIPWWSTMKLILTIRTFNFFTHWLLREKKADININHDSFLLDLLPTKYQMN
jgi:hypothetical protein